MSAALLPLTAPPNVKEVWGCSGQEGMCPEIQTIGRALPGISVLIAVRMDFTARKSIKYQLSTISEAAWSFKCTNSSGNLELVCYYWQMMT